MMFVIFSCQSRIAKTTKTRHFPSQPSQKNFGVTIIHNDSVRSFYAQTLTIELYIEGWKVGRFEGHFL